MQNVNVKKYFVIEHDIDKMEFILFITHISSIL